MKYFSDEQFKEFKSLVLSCGEFMTNATVRENGSDDIKKKCGDADFVTVYDEGVQKLLIDGISKLFPDANFFAEEKENFEEDVKNGICFIIDPIDGTTNFIHALDASAISVAMTFDGEPVFGCVYDPYRKELFTAIKGEGAFRNDERIFVSSRDIDTSVISFGTTPYRKKEYASDGFAIAERIFCSCADIRRSGSAAIDMANVACGRLDGFFECILCPWDYAAGTVLITEAGGRVSDFNGNDVNLSAPAPLLCSNKIIHNKLMALINN